MKINAFSGSAKSLFGRAIAIGVLSSGMLAMPYAQAAFHLWTITEVYTDSTGNLQFIELVDNFGGQNFIGGQGFQVSNVGNTLTHTYTFPTSLPSDGAGTHLLLGTAGIQAAGGPAPDFIIPNNFLFAAGGSFSFYNASGAYPALPTDGSLSYTWGGGTAVNSPVNFSGNSGKVVVPEPTSLSLIGLMGCSLWCAFRSSRRREN